MTVVYCSPGSPRDALEAAAAALGRGGSFESVQAVGPAEAGPIYLVGREPHGGEVYACGLGGSLSTAICLRAASGISEAFGLSGRVRLVQCGGPWPPDTVDPASTGVCARPFNVIYHCYGSAHSSVVTASIHLSILPASRVPSVDEVQAVPLFDRVPHSAVGRPFFVGEDESGAGVFVIGLGPAVCPARRFVADFIKICGLSDRAVLVGCLELAGPLVRVGGFLSRRLGLVVPGRVIAAAGIRRGYWGFVSLACRTRLEVVARLLSGGGG